MVDAIAVNSAQRELHSLKKHGGGGGDIGDAHTLLGTDQLGDDAGSGCFAGTKSRDQLALAGLCPSLAALQKSTFKSSRSARCFRQWSVDYRAQD
jgi:hypothetical protein